MLLRRLNMTETLLWHAHPTYRESLRAELEDFAGRNSAIEVLDCGGETLARWERPRANGAALRLLTERLSAEQFRALRVAAYRCGETISEYVGRLAANRPDVVTPERWLETPNNEGAR